MHPALKLRHIRVFLAVAEAGGLSAAAGAMGLTQPALSKSIGEMEALLGGPLFLRQGRGMILTPAGERFRRHAREAMAALDAAARAMHPETEAGSIAVGVLPTVSTRFFPLVAKRFVAEHPEVTLSMETGSHAYLLQKLRDRHIDLMIGRMPMAAEMTGLQFDFLYEEQIVLAARAGHPLARADAREVLVRSPLILPTRDAIIRRVVDDYLASVGLAGAKPAVETSTLALGRGLLLASDAVWFISRGVIGNELASGQLVTIGLGASYLSGAVGLAALQSSSPSGALRRLLQLIRDQSREWIEA